MLLLQEFEFELLLVQSGKRSCFRVSTSISGSLLGSCPAKLWGLGDIGGINGVELVWEASSDDSTLILLNAERVHEFEVERAGEDRRQLLPLLLLLGELKGRGVNGCDTLATTLEFLTRSKRSGALLASFIVGPCFETLSVGVSFEGAMLTSGGVGVGLPAGGPMLPVLLRSLPSSLVAEVGTRGGGVVGVAMIGAAPTLPFAVRRFWYGLAVGSGRLATGVDTAAGEHDGIEEIVTSGGGCVELCIGGFTIAR